MANSTRAPYHLTRIPNKRHSLRAKAPPWPNHLYKESADEGTKTMLVKEIVSWEMQETAERKELRLCGAVPGTGARNRQDEGLFPEGKEVH